MAAPDDTALLSPDDLDFEMVDGVPTLTPEEARARKARRRAQSSAAARSYLAAEANGLDFDQLKLAARRAAARVKDLAAASVKVEGAVADLDHLGEHHPAVVLLVRALELIEREQLALVGRRGASS